MYGNYTRFLMNQARIRQDQDRADWMKAYQADVIAARPELAGRVNWDTADFFFRNGRSAFEAARLALENNTAGRA